MGQDFWDRIISKLSALRVVPRECSCRLVVRSASEPDLLYLYSFRLDSMSSSSSSTLSSYSTSSSSTSISPPSQHRSVPIAAILAPVLGIGALLLILLYLWRRRNKHNGPVTSPERLAFSRNLRSSIIGNKISVVPTFPSSDTSPILSLPISPSPAGQMLLRGGLQRLPRKRCRDLQELLQIVRATGASQPPPEYGVSPRRPNC